MSKRKKRLAQELGSFLQQYQRPSNPNIDSNDRRYDRRVEQQVRRLGAEEFDALRDSSAEPDLKAAHELGLAGFLLPERRGRFRQLLGSERGRAKLRRSLAHFQDLDPATCERVRVAEQSAAGVEALLVRAGAPETCYVVAEEPMLDGLVLPLLDVLRVVVGGGLGAFISCKPARLAYFEGEEPGERYMLRRGAA